VASAVERVSACVTLCVATHIKTTLDPIDTAALPQRAYALRDAQLMARFRRRRRRCRRRRRRRLPTMASFCNKQRRRRDFEYMLDVAGVLIHQVSPVFAEGQRPQNPG
jgi:hypothetical protein